MYEESTTIKFLFQEYIWGSYLGLTGAKIPKNMYFLRFLVKDLNFRAT